MRDTIRLALCFTQLALLLGFLFSLVGHEIKQHIYHRVHEKQMFIWHAAHPEAAIFVQNDDIKIIGNRFE